MGSQNPYINTCRIDHRGTFCQACWGTLLEIGRWGRMGHQGAEKQSGRRLFGLFVDVVNGQDRITS